MTAIPFPLLNIPVEIRCDSVGYAFKVIDLARSMCIHASYHPSGGETHLKNYPIAHQVWVMGDESQIEQLKSAIVKLSETK